MVIDSSAIIAILSNEPEAERFMKAISDDSWRNFGKGRHPAGLNIGDCCSYALAKYSDEPLLFKGDDFGKTDVKIFGDGI